MRGRAASLLAAGALFACGPSWDALDPSLALGSGGESYSGKCVTTADCAEAAGECEMASCIEGECSMTPILEGTVLAEQIAGDCVQRECDGEGAVQSIPDDGDVVDDMNPCTTDKCDAGSPVHSPAPALTKCANGICDGKGKCISW